MTTALQDHTLLPPAQSLDELSDLVTSVLPPNHAQLVSPTGAQVTLPDEILEALRITIIAMAAGQAVTIALHHQRLTTQEAADILGISRPTLIRLLDRGEIPFEQPGKHRRVLLKDLLDYQERRHHERGKALDEMVTIGEEAGIYEATATPRRTR